MPDQVRHDGSGFERLGQRPPDGLELLQWKGASAARPGRLRYRLDRVARLGLGSPARQQLLDPADRIAVLVEQAVDPARQSDVGGAVVTAVAGALERLQLREAALPIAQYMLGDVELGRELADRPEGLFALAGGVPHGRSRPWPSGRRLS